MEEKYKTLLAPDMLKFIETVEAYYPPDSIEMTIAEQRNLYSELSKAFDGQWPKTVVKSDEFYNSREGSVPVRHYVNKARKAKGRVVYFHGGGFILGGFDSHESVCADLCAQSECDVTAVDYRLSPEHTHPAALDDCLTAFRRVASDWNSPIMLVGDSAGGTLAASVSHETRQEKYKPHGQILIYPALGGDMSVGSYVEHRFAPLLSTPDIEYYEELRSGGRNLNTDVTAKPLAAKDFRSLPNTVVFAAEADPLCDDGEVYCSRILEAGGQAQNFLEPGLVHGYLRARYTVKNAKESFSRIVEAIDRLAAAE